MESMDVLKPMRRKSRTVPLVLLALLGACTSTTDSPVAPTGLAGTGSASTKKIFIDVDDDAAPGGNGSARSPFDNLPAAVAYARTVSGAVTIRVAPGDYALSQTLVIDRSLELRGSTQQAAGTDSWPSGEVVPGTATRVYASSSALPLLVTVDSGDGSVLTDVQVRGENPDRARSATKLRAITFHE